MGLLDSCVLLVIIVSFCAYINYQYVTDWNSISLEDIALSNIIPLFWLTIIRLFFAMVIWGSTGISVLDPEGLKLELRNREGKYVKIIIKHFQRLTFFTFWCWMLHGVYFVLTGIASLSILLGFNLKDMIGAKWIHALCALVWVTYEISFAVSFLVSIIVTYVLIPDSMKRGDAVNILFRPVALLTHNANIVFMVFELLVNRLRFHATHFTFAIIFGLLYIVFSWVLYSRIKLFYYFFLDYNRKDNIIVYTGLATVLSLFFFGGYGLSALYQSHPHFAVPVLSLAVYMCVKLTK